MTKDTGEHDEHEPANLKAESRELMDIESTDDAIEELEKEDKDETVESEKSETTPHLKKVQPPNAWQRFWTWFWDKKLLTMPLVVLVILGILLLIPVTRYGMTGWFWKEAIVIQVNDDSNGHPVTEATVTIADQTVKTDNKGKASLAAIAVGIHDLTIAKKNYQTLTSTIEVPLLARGKEFQMKFHATGRVSEITVTNRISGKAIAGALMTISKDDQARTDESGKAQVVVPTDKTEIQATVTAVGYLDANVTIKQTAANTVQLTPTGKMYFLSKKTGKIDVVKTNLDGTERQTVVSGTGQEDDHETSLLAARDWQYLLLKAKRDSSSYASLYLYDTTKASFDMVDQGKAYFNLIGWAGHNFFYSVNREDVAAGQNGQQALKMFNAETRKLTTVDETQAQILSPGASYGQSFGNFYIVNDGVIYTNVWTRSGYAAVEPTDKLTEIDHVGSDGSGKRALKTYPSQTIAYIEAKLYEPQSVDFRITKSDNNAQPLYAEVEDGVYREGIDGSKFDSDYPTFIISPDGTQSFWSESRDGKNTLLLGGKNAENKQEIATLSDFKAYGWFTNDYLLMQKADSELYITTPAKLKAGATPIKISDYHKPTSINGYGYGYGGQ